jgi:hypothetical protein
LIIYPDEIEFNVLISKLDGGVALHFRNELWMYLLDWFEPALRCRATVINAQLQAGLHGWF